MTSVSVSIRASRSETRSETRSAPQETSNAELPCEVNPCTGSGTLLTGLEVNQLRDSGVFTIPLASSVPANTLITIELPEAYGGETPSVVVSGTDVFRDGSGTDTAICFIGPARIVMTSNGVSEWSL